MDKVSVQSIDYHGNKIRVFHYDGERWYIAQDLVPFMGRVRETLRQRGKKDANVRRVYVEILSVNANNLVNNVNNVNNVGNVGNVSNNLVALVSKERIYGPAIYAAVNEYGVRNMAARGQKGRLYEFLEAVISGRLLHSEYEVGTAGLPYGDSSEHLPLAEYAGKIPYQERGATLELNASTKEASVAIRITFKAGISASRMRQIRENILQGIDSLQDGE